MIPVVPPMVPKIVVSFLSRRRQKRFMFVSVAAKTKTRFSGPWGVPQESLKTIVFFYFLKIFSCPLQFLLELRAERQSSLRVSGICFDELFDLVQKRRHGKHNNGISSFIERLQRNIVSLDLYVTTFVLCVCSRV